MRRASAQATGIAHTGGKDYVGFQCSESLLGLLLSGVCLRVSTLLFSIYSNLNVRCQNLSIQIN